MLQEFVCVLGHKQTPATFITLYLFAARHRLERLVDTPRCTLLHLPSLGGLELSMLRCNGVQQNCTIRSECVHRGCVMLLQVSRHWVNTSRNNSLVEPR